MASTSNKWTQQTPISGSTVRAILAQRVYANVKGTAFADPTARLNGVDTELISAQWDDLGIVKDSTVELTYSKTMSYIETGIDKVRRGAYLTQKTAQAVFTLEQFDAAVLETISGNTKSNLGTSPVIGSKIHIGSEDVIELALLFYGVNKIDGKEYIIYSQDAVVSFEIAKDGDATIMKCTADLLAFQPTGQSVDSFFSIFIVD